MTIGTTMAAILLSGPGVETIVVGVGEGSGMEVGMQLSSVKDER